ncbi:TlyA family rRNA (cytidine-2'-O)-methyltransferase [soil metagenome]
MGPFFSPLSRGEVKSLSRLSSFPFYTSCMIRTRLDEALVARGLYPSRARARDAILRGTVTIDGALAVKPSQGVGPEAGIAIADPAQTYVSRAALKLVHALDHFALSPAGLDCLDIGASTGGFTQVLLERGASSVTAIDVGHGQMDAKIASDVRVKSIEGLNARDLTLAHLPFRPGFIVCDVSFISLTLALGPALDIAADHGEFGHFAPLVRTLVALIKPQFEAGRAALGRGGIVTDPAIHAEVTRSIAAWLDARSWQVKGVIPSPLTGGDGNREFLIAAEKPC